MQDARGCGDGRTELARWERGGAEAEVRTSGEASEASPSVDAEQAQVLLVALADRVGRTPWELDHAIWRRRPTAARSRRKAACRDDV